MKAEITLLKIPVSEIDRAIPFYRDAMGWQREFAMAEYGWAQFKWGELSVALYQPGMGGGSRKPGGSLDFHIGVTNLAALQSRLIEHLPDIEAEIFTNDDETQTLEFQDPDGNEWKIAQLG